MGIRLYHANDRTKFVKLYCCGEFEPWDYVGDVSISMINIWLETYKFCDICTNFLQYCVNNNIDCIMF